jgi:hypothetical protein
MNQEDDELAHSGNGIKASKHPIEPIFVTRHGHVCVRVLREADRLRVLPSRHAGDDRKVGGARRRRSDKFVDCGNDPRYRRGFRATINIPTPRTATSTHWKNSGTIGNPHDLHETVGVPKSRYSVFYR